MRTGSTAIVLVALFSLLSLFTGEARAEKKIGILMFSEETRYAEAARGFKESLAEAGFGASKVSYFSESAGGNKAKAAEIAKKFAAIKPDLILSLGTSATLPLIREIKDVPIVFSVVYDPVDAGIATSWLSSGNNTTGTSPLVPMTKLMDVLKKFAPVERVAILYTPGEKNSETQVRELQKLQEQYRIKVIPVRLTKKEEVAQLLPEVLRVADALYITGSNLVNSQIQLIIDLSAKAKVITLTHLDDLVVKGALIGVTTDTRIEGRLAGKKAVKILKGARPSSIPIEMNRKVSVLLNMNTAKKGAFTVPASFRKIVTKNIE